MAEDYRNQAIGVFELESECICFVALDAAAKATAVRFRVWREIVLRQEPA